MRSAIGGSVGLCLFVVTAALAAPAPTPTALRYKFKKGDRLNYLQEEKFQMTMKVAGRDVQFSMTHTVDLIWDTLEVDPRGHARINQTVERLRMVVEGPPPIGKAQYDSREGKLPEGPLFEKIGPMLVAMVGQPATLLVDPSGKAKVVKVPEKYQKELKKLSEANKAAGMPTEAISPLFAQGALVLPNYSASKGRVWEDTTVATVPGGKITVRSAFEHEGVEVRGGRRLEVIAIKPTTKFESDGSRGALRYKGQEASGKAFVDRGAGRLVETTVTVKLDLEMEINGTTIQQQTQHTRSMKLKE